jgi:electron transport complex protein RnfC
MITFRGGIHPPEFKELAEEKPIEVMPRPKQVVLPLSQHTGAPAKPVVNVGDEVKAGTLIAEPVGMISAPVHSSIAGKVKGIEHWVHPVLPVPTKSVIIEAGEEDEADPEIKPRSDNEIEELKPDDIREIIRDAGIVGLGGAAFPTAVKVTPPKDAKIDTLIINGAECEPFLTADDRLMREKSVWPDAEVLTVKTKYPQGAEKQLISAILGREVPAGGLPFMVGVVVQNAGTAYAVWEAVAKRKPLYERVVTVTGPGIAEPKNLLVRIGTLAADVISHCGGLRPSASKFISGGPMMGIAQASGAGDQGNIGHALSGLLQAAVCGRRGVKLHTMRPLRGHLSHEARSCGNRTHGRVREA